MRPIPRRYIQKQSGTIVAYPNKFNQTIVDSTSFNTYVSSLTGKNAK